MSEFIINYVRLNDDTRECVPCDETDAAERADIIEHALLPVADGGRGWAFGAQNHYMVMGDIGSKRSVLRLYDDSALVALVGVCLDSRVSSNLWTVMHTHARIPLDLSKRPPPPPWCALRCDGAETALDWLDRWARNAGIALATRAGW